MYSKEKINHLVIPDTNTLQQSPLVNDFKEILRSKDVNFALSLVTMYEFHYIREVSYASGKITREKMNEVAKDYLELWSFNPLIANDSIFSVERQSFSLPNNATPVKIFSHGLRGDMHFDKKYIANFISHILNIPPESALTGEDIKKCFSDPLLSKKFSNKYKSYEDCEKAMKCLIKNNRHCYAHIINANNTALFFASWFFILASLSVGKNEKMNSKDDMTNIQNDMLFCSDGIIEHSIIVSNDAGVIERGNYLFKFMGIPSIVLTTEEYILCYKEGIESIPREKNEKFFLYKELYGSEFDHAKYRSFNRVVEGKSGDFMIIDSVFPGEALANEVIELVPESFMNPFNPS